MRFANTFEGHAGRPGEVGGSEPRNGGTDSKAFKAWFGKSKMVDAAGKPLVVYHGTHAPKDFNAFKVSGVKDSGWFGQGYYFSANPIDAGSYAHGSGGGFDPASHGRVFPVYLRMEHPLVFEDTEDFAKKVKQLGGDPTLKGKAMADQLKKLGFDGAHSNDMREIVAFDSNQIKSTLNRGAWSLKSKNISNAFDSGHGLILESVTSFSDALRSNTVKALLPTSLTSEQLSEIDAAIKRMGFFSAKNTNAVILQRAKDLIDSILQPKLVDRALLDGTQVRVEEGFNLATARADLKTFGQSIGYEAPQGKSGSIQDLFSDNRLNLVLNTNTDLAYGWGHYRQSQDQDVLDVYPAWELARAEGRHVPRDWVERWQAAGGEFYDGRLIAAKDSDVWQALGDGAGGYDDTLGNPFPPFAFNSGMDVFDISRFDAIDLGVIEPDQIIEVQDVGIADNLKASPAVSGDLKLALLASQNEGDAHYRLDGDTLVANESPFDMWSKIEEYLEQIAA